MKPNKIKLECKTITIICEIVYGKCNISNLEVLAIRRGVFMLVGAEPVVMYSICDPRTSKQIRDVSLLHCIENDAHGIEKLLLKHK